MLWICLLIGSIFTTVILILYLFSKFIVWLALKQYEAEKKVATDYIDFTYDSTGRKNLGHELRLLTRETENRKEDKGHVNKTRNEKNETI
jgi:hypothetical protein